MTMLDRMRRHKGWLKWSLGLVVVAFIILYIPDFLRAKDPAGGALPGDQIAQVNGRGVSVLEFRTAYQRQVAAYRQAYGANVSEQLLRQLGFEQLHSGSHPPAFVILKGLGPEAILNATKVYRPIKGSGRTREYAPNPLAARNTATET